MCNLGFQQWLFHKMTSGEMEDVPVIEEINNQTGSLVTKDNNEKLEFHEDAPVMEEMNNRRSLDTKYVFHPLISFLLILCGTYVFHVNIPMVELVSIINKIKKTFTVSQIETLHFWIRGE